MTVAVVIKGHDMVITPRLRTYVEKKVGKLDHYLEAVTDANVELTHHKTARSAADRQVAQLTVRGRRGLMLRTEERADDMFAAVDATIDKMHRQIERYKGKHRRGRGDGASAATVAGMLAEEETDEEQNPIVRRKRFPLRPMDELEALEQMHLLGHGNFFVFYNVETDTINVLYQRRDGSYGLIEPELA